ncbi:MAG: hypothetical protein Tsb005_12510 [Gammaproteobacteria bacterium]
MAIDVKNINRLLNSRNSYTFIANQIAEKIPSNIYLATPTEYQTINNLVKESVELEQTFYKKRAELLRELVKIVARNYSLYHYLIHHKNHFSEIVDSTYILDLQDEIKTIATLLDELKIYLTEALHNDVFPHLKHNRQLALWLISGFLSEETNAKYLWSNIKDGADYIQTLKEITQLQKNISKNNSINFPQLPPINVHKYYISRLKKQTKFAYKIIKKIKENAPLNELRLSHKLSSLNEEHINFEYIENEPLGRKIIELSELERETQYKKQKASYQKMTAVNNADAFAIEFTAKSLDALYMAIKKQRYEDADNYILMFSELLELTSKKHDYQKNKRAKNIINKLKFQFWQSSSLSYISYFFSGQLLRKRHKHYQYLKLHELFTQISEEHHSVILPNKDKKLSISFLTFIKKIFFIINPFATLLYKIQHTNAKNNIINNTYNVSPVIQFVNKKSQARRLELHELAPKIAHYIDDNYRYHINLCKKIPTEIPNHYSEKEKQLLSIFIKQHNQELHDYYKIEFMRIKDTFEHFQSRSKHLKRFTNFIYRTFSSRISLFHPSFYNLLTNLKQYGYYEYLNEAYEKYVKNVDLNTDCTFDYYAQLNKINNLLIERLSNVSLKSINTNNFDASSIHEVSKKINNVARVLNLTYGIKLAIDPHTKKPLAHTLTQQPYYHKVILSNLNHKKNHYHRLKSILKLTAWIAMLLLAFFQSTVVTATILAFAPVLIGSPYVLPILLGIFLIAIINNLIIKNKTYKFLKRNVGRFFSKFGNSFWETLTPSQKFRINLDITINFIITLIVAIFTFKAVSFALPILLFAAFGIINPIGFTIIAAALLAALVSVICFTAFRSEVNLIYSIKNSSFLSRLKSAFIPELWEYMSISAKIANTIKASVRLLFYLALQLFMLTFSLIVPLIGFIAPGILYGSFNISAQVLLPNAIQQEVSQATGSGITQLLIGISNIITTIIDLLVDSIEGLPHFIYSSFNKKNYREINGLKLSHNAFSAQKKLVSLYRVDTSLFSFKHKGILKLNTINESTAKKILHLLPHMHFSHLSLSSIDPEAAKVFGKHFSKNYALSTLVLNNFSNEAITNILNPTIGYVLHGSQNLRSHLRILKLKNCNSENQIQSAIQAISQDLTPHHELHTLSLDNQSFQQFNQCLTQNIIDLKNTNLISLKFSKPLSETLDNLNLSTDQLSKIHILTISHTFISEKFVDNLLNSSHAIETLQLQNLKISSKLKEPGLSVYNNFTHQLKKLLTSNNIKHLVFSNIDSHTASAIIQVLNEMSVNDIATDKTIELINNEKNINQKIIGAINRYKNVSGNLLDYKLHDSLDSHLTHLWKSFISRINNIQRNINSTVVNPFSISEQESQHNAYVNKKDAWLVKFKNIHPATYQEVTSNEFDHQQQHDIVFGDQPFESNENNCSRKDKEPTLWPEPSLLHSPDSIETKLLTDPRLKDDIREYEASVFNKKRVSTPKVSLLNQHTRFFTHNTQTPNTTLPCKLPSYKVITI